MPDPADLTIYQGDDYIAQVSVFYPDATTPADLTGYTAKAQIRTAVADEAPTVTATFECSISANVITMLLRHDRTTLLKGSLVWDVQITDPTNWITTLLYGKVVITSEVTRDPAAVSQRQIGPASPAPHALPPAPTGVRPPVTLMVTSIGQAIAVRPGINLRPGF